jgi:hypothetical protein
MGFEEDQALDIETRDAAREAKTKLENWAYEKLARRLEVNHATKVEVVGAYNSLSPVHKLAVNKRFQFTESEVYMAEEELTWNKHTGREGEVEEMRLILEEEKRVLAQAIKSVTKHILLQRGVNPRLVDVMVDIPDRQARKIAIRELLKSLK